MPPPAIGTESPQAARSRAPNPRRSTAAPLAHMESSAHHPRLEKRACRSRQLCFVVSPVALRHPCCMWVGGAPGFSRPSQTMQGDCRTIPATTKISSPTGWRLSPALSGWRLSRRLSESTPRMRLRLSGGENLATRRRRQRVESGPRPRRRSYAQFTADGSSRKTASRRQRRYSTK